MLSAGSASKPNDAGPVCPECGYNPAGQAVAEQRRIADLEGQVKVLGAKAATTADKIADYEDEIRYLRSQNQLLSQQTRTGSSDQSLSQNTSPGRGVPFSSSIHPLTNAQSVPPAAPLAATSTSTRLATLTSYFPGRRPSPLSSNNASLAAAPALQSPGFPPPQTPISGTAVNGMSDVHSLTQLLNQERAARQKIESQLSAQSREVEDLTAQLFSQANEMVASERKAKARLEERIKELEKSWEGRKERLKTLEARVERAQRIRDLAGPTAAHEATGIDLKKT